MSYPSLTPKQIKEMWKKTLWEGEPLSERRKHQLFHKLPSDPRCKTCYAPFKGVGGFVVSHTLGIRPSRMNPLVCNQCEIFAQMYQGGAEVELAMVFADIRGSTGLAEKMEASEFSELIDRFYQEATHVLIHKLALIDKLAGDQVSGLFVPGFAGQGYAQAAVEAARELMGIRGEGRRLPVGIGVHAGKAFVGAVGRKGGTVDITALGDAPNVAARLASAAEAGTILISREVAEAAGVKVVVDGWKKISVKGRKQPVTVQELEG